MTASHAAQGRSLVPVIVDPTQVLATEVHAMVKYWFNFTSHPPLLRPQLLISKP
jgi:hypothetical protein